MARKVKGGKAKHPGGSKRSKVKAPRPAARPGVASKAKRLPSGSYAWKGRAVSFGKLPKAEKARIRSSWAVKAAKTARAGQAPKDRRSVKVWLDRRTDKLGIRGDARYMEPAEIAGQVPTGRIMQARAAQKEAHRAWVSQGKHGGGDALIIAEGIQRSLGAELAAAMPQLWWYH